MDREDLPGGVVPPPAGGARPHPRPAAHGGSDPDVVGKVANLFTPRVRPAHRRTRLDGTVLVPPESSRQRPTPAVGGDSRRPTHAGSRPRGSAAPHRPVRRGHPAGGPPGDSGPRPGFAHQPRHAALRRPRARRQVGEVPVASAARRCGRVPRVPWHFRNKRQLPVPPSPRALSAARIGPDVRGHVRNGTGSSPPHGATHRTNVRGGRPVGRRQPPGGAEVLDGATVRTPVRRRAEVDRVHLAAAR